MVIVSGSFTVHHVTAGHMGNLSCIRAGLPTVTWRTLNSQLTGTGEDPVSHANVDHTQCALAQAHSQKHVIDPGPPRPKQIIGSLDSRSRLLHIP